MRPYVLGENEFTVIVDGVPYTVQKSHPNYGEVLEKFETVSDEELLELLDTTKAVQKFCGDRIEISDGVLKFDGEEISGVLVARIFQMMEEGFDIEPMLNFLINVQENPSYRATQELYGFLEYARMAITPDGCFLAYKKIRGDYTDIYTGKFDNSPGAICEMPRNKVDEDSNRTCSAGLHVCSYEYLKHFGNTSTNVVVEVKINPADVVAVPKDYNNTKMRVCKYKVIQVLNNYEADPLTKTSVKPSENLINYDNPAYDYCANCNSDETYFTDSGAEIICHDCGYQYA